ncbi:7-deoxyloganetin glucosyltransferase-like [Selaginella moellendorffii]|uniref:7-deoxyloganetin glucosyltransferase-like n=1 Tax=Selaginella moellendorffii TaxID=88036 RepID=UPI000D1C587B|nr:7-deoxyloganetin glucosyltransferase-like [Selaginella moellendorffii]|eukprot:XP_024528780.1 7-deoxyloganetin glucosyltransferase-like [Selaginella moellendorffii]
MLARKPHLVALALTGEGHVTPMMHLCAFLSKVHKFSITFALLSSLDSILRKKSWPPPGTDITLVEVQGTPYVHPERPPASKRFDITPIHEHWKEKFPEPLKRFLEELQFVDCLVCDYQLSWAIDVASKLGISGAILFTGCVTWSWFESNMAQLVSTGVVPMEDQELAEDEDYPVLEKPVKLRRSDIPWHFWNNRPWQEYTINSNADAFVRARWTLVSSCEELEPELTGAMKQAIGGDKFLPVGPLFLLGDRPEDTGFTSFDPKCLGWLDQQPDKSVLYIAFGSVAELSIEELVEFGEGLVASKQKFLWVTRPSKDEKTNEFYESFGDKNREQGFVTSWAPQARVLSHSSVGAFLSHCGWNSTIEGVSSGKVILCWPCLFDQNLNRRLVVENWRVGFGFDKTQGKVRREEVERVIRLAMKEDQGREARRRVEELSGKMKRAVTVPGGVSLQNLEKFVWEIVSSRV